MRTLCVSVLCALILVAGFKAPAQNSQPPVVTGVTAAQQPFPAKDVIISYTISDPVSTRDNVWIVVSADGGNTWTLQQLAPYKYSFTFINLPFLLSIPLGGRSIFPISSVWRVLL